MNYKVLQRFLTKKGLYMPGDVYENPNPGKFTKNLVRYGFIEESPANESKYGAWERDGVKSTLAGVIIAPEDYAEGDKKHFTWDEAMKIEKKLDNGWRLPTRSEWALICEEFGQKDGELNADTLIKNIGVGRHGYAASGGIFNVGSYGYCWSSTPSGSDSAYYLCLGSSYANPSSISARCNGFSVRLVKDLEGRNE